MQFTAFILAAFAGLAAAGPIQERQLGLCSSALDTAQCCDLSVDGVLVLNCESPSTTPTSTADFNNICAAGGQSAQCCTLPLAGDALLCHAP